MNIKTLYQKSSTQEIKLILSLQNQGGKFINFSNLFLGIRT